ncbi:MAG: polymer-forming cytoskeletal protein [Oligoflexia bacterium]|nr:polymer-forming cytoskeletal protein [Oligoflexia bacterium]
MKISWEQIQESAINVIAEETRIEGKIVFDQISRVHGVLVGEVKAKNGSTLILAETAMVEGSIDADRLIIDGYVKGDIVAHGKVTISRTGRVVGNIHAPSLELEFGSYFEGKCAMENGRGAVREATQLA